MSENSLRETLRRWLDKWRGDLREQWIIELEVALAAPNPTGTTLNNTQIVAAYLEYSEVVYERDFLRECVGAATKALNLDPNGETYEHCGQHSMDCDECHMFRKLHPKERQS